jgi:hypothetical protein
MVWVPEFDIITNEVYGIWLVEVISIVTVFKNLNEVKNRASFPFFFVFPQHTQRVRYSTIIFNNLLQIYSKMYSSMNTNCSEKNSPVLVLQYLVLLNCLVLEYSILD